MKDQILRPEGNFSFVPAHGTYCSDVLPQTGYQIVHATFVQALPLSAGFEAIQAHLAGCGRPVQALCGLELRIAQALGFTDFDSFNQKYVALLDQYQLRNNAGESPRATMTRTNVAPETHAAKPSEPSIFAFSYVVAGSRTAGRKSFVCSGSGELAGTGRDSIISLGDTSPVGLRAKARWVMQNYDQRIADLGLSWADVTCVNLYCVHPPTSFFEPEMLTVMGRHAGLGVHWHYARPPIIEIEFEADLRGAALEEYL